MRVRKIHYWILLISFLASVGAGFQYFNDVKNPESRGLLFITIGVNQKLLASESSSYELQRASEHFSDLVLGWAAEPSFASELDAKLAYHLNFNGVRQEKQNLIFNLSADISDYNSSAGDVFLNLIESRIKEYNSMTNAGYVVALSRYSDLKPSDFGYKSLFGISFLTFLSTALILISFEYAIKNSCRFTTSS